jgi:hypothetical protein
MLVVGSSVGILFGLIYALVYRADLDTAAWSRSLRLAVAGLVGGWLLPFLRYPANPPGVGDGDTVSARTDAWLAATVMGLVSVAGAWLLHSWLATRGAPVPLRQTVVAAMPVATLVLMFVILPNNPDPVEVPAKLLWDFRILSAASMIVLWMTLGVVLGLLGLRTARRHRPAGSPVA